MDLKTLKAALNDFPENASVELSRLIAADVESEDHDAYDVMLDFPIIGLAYNEESNDLRLVVSTTKDDRWLKKFGKVTPFGGEDAQKEKEKPYTA